MLRAINAMSRAEAELNGGRAPEALVFEKAALAALEKAFDRRRYFLRTLTERARIDPARRLTGDLKDARSWTRGESAVPAPPSLEAQRLLMRDLSAAVPTERGSAAALAARVATIDPASVDLQKAAVAIATANLPHARRDAMAAAMRALAAHAAAELASGGGRGYGGRRDGRPAG